MQIIWEPAKNMLVKTNDFIISRYILLILSLLCIGTSKYTNKLVTKNYWKKYESFITWRFVYNLLYIMYLLVYLNRGDNCNTNSLNHIYYAIPVSRT